MNIITHSKTLKILIYNDKRKNDKYLINNNFINHSLRIWTVLIKRLNLLPLKQNFFLEKWKFKFVEIIIFIKYLKLFTRIINIDFVN